MSVTQSPNFNNGSGPGKKAVHVKWAGKTIALGTFPSAEADEKCARAKALTRAWRSTMRPKPSRDWVMIELERLGVRVVSGRLGRKAGEDDEPVETKPSSAPAPHQSSGGAGPPSSAAGMPWGASNAELDSLMQRRNSSLGLSMMSDRDLNRRGSLGSLGPVLGLESNDPTMPPHRPLVGGGSAAAYEAARADHYQQKREEQQQRASGLGLNMGGGGMQMGLSVNPNQHYEMLKLHHMNLLNEIQETTLMMNLYQQQQLQQQQQQLQLQQEEAAHSRGSLGLGMSEDLPAPAPAPTKPKKAPAAKSTPGASKKSSSSSKKKDKDKESKKDKKQIINGPEKESDVASKEGNAALQEELLRGQREQEELEKKLQKLKDDIAQREKEAEELQIKADEAAAKAAAAKNEDAKRSAAKPTGEETDVTSEPEPKKMKVEDKQDEDDTAED